MDAYSLVCLEQSYVILESTFSFSLVLHIRLTITMVAVLMMSNEKGTIAVSQNVCSDSEPVPKKVTSWNLVATAKIQQIPRPDRTAAFFHE